MKPSKWIANFLISHPPALPDVSKNVDWQHRIKVLEDEIKAKDKKIEEQRSEIGRQDEKLSEARTVAADLLRQFAPLQESEINLKSSNRLYLLGNDSLRAQVAPLNEEIERLKAANRVLKDNSKRKDDEIVHVRQSHRVIVKENSYLRRTLKSLSLLIEKAIQYDGATKSDVAIEESINDCTPCDTQRNE